jgi:hypothetical protein
MAVRRGNFPSHGRYLRRRPHHHSLATVRYAYEAATILQKYRLQIMPDITDAELDAATEAYVRERWPNVSEWRKAYPQAWNETRERIRIALEAATKVRTSG